MKSDTGNDRGQGRAERRGQDVNGADVMALIRDGSSRMSKGHKAIASYIMEHYEQAVFMTAARLGAETNVSESTVVRFALRLGYEGYPQFQQALAGWVANRLNRLQSVGDKCGDSGQSQIVTSVLQGDIDRIRDTMSGLDPLAFEMAVDILLEAKTVYILGIRSCEPLADFLSFYLNMIRGNVILLQTTSISEIFEQMLRIDSQDALVGISFPRYSMRTLKAMEFANDRNAKVVAITDSANSPMNLYSSCNLLAKTDMVSIVDSLVAPLSIINALVVAMCLKRPAKVKESLETLEGAWKNYQVYLHDEIDFIDEEKMLQNPLGQPTKK